MYIYMCHKAGGAKFVYSAFGDSGKTIRYVYTQTLAETSDGRDDRFSEASTTARAPSAFRKRENGEAK